ncbi:MAG: hypothetical protein AB2L24_05185 [Mangrovibacterium sp.]
MRRKQRHIVFISGLWLAVMIWPVLSLPVHFFVVAHERHDDTHDLHPGITRTQGKCLICSFDFYRVIPAPLLQEPAPVDFFIRVYDQIVVSRLYQNIFLPFFLRAPPSVVI